MNTKVDISIVQYGYANLAVDALYIWLPPYLILPINASLEQMHEAIEVFQDKCDQNAKEIRHTNTDKKGASTCHVQP